MTLCSRGLYLLGGCGNKYPFGVFKHQQVAYIIGGATSKVTINFNTFSENLFAGYRYMCRNFFIPLAAHDNRKIHKPETLLGEFENEKVRDSNEAVESGKPRESISKGIEILQ